jgi:hypothetical protein
VPSASPSSVTFSLACQAAVGAVCRVLAQLTTLEHLLGNQVVALSARARHHKKRLLVGSTSLTLAPGAQQKIVVQLNGTGRQLLAHLGRIPATLTITLLNANPATVITTKTTIKAKTRSH